MGSISNLIGSYAARPSPGGAPRTMQSMGVGDENQKMGRPSINGLNEGGMPGMASMKDLGLGGTAQSLVKNVAQIPGASTVAQMAGTAVGGPVVGKIAGMAVEKAADQARAQDQAQAQQAQAQPHGEGEDIDMKLGEMFNQMLGNLGIKKTQKNAARMAIDS